MDKNAKRAAASDYVVTTCAPGELSDSEREACLAIIKAGGAVAVDSAKLKHAKLLAVARLGSEIVGVGTVKRQRPDYAQRIGTRSGFQFPQQTLELGYLAVEGQHRRKGLSHRLVAALLAGKHGGLFSTTYDKRMKKVLAAAGFVQRGHNWPGKSEPLSLWMYREKGLRD